MTEYWNTADLPAKCKSIKSVEAAHWDTQRLPAKFAEVNHSTLWQGICLVGGWLTHSSLDQPLLPSKYWRFRVVYCWFTNIMTCIMCVCCFHRYTAITIASHICGPPSGLATGQWGRLHLITPGWSNKKMWKTICFPSYKWRVNSTSSC